MEHYGLNFIDGIAVGLKEVAESGHNELAASSLYSLLQGETLSLKECVAVCEIILNNSFFDSVQEFWINELEDYKSELAEAEYYDKHDSDIIIAEEAYSW